MDERGPPVLDIRTYRVVAGGGEKLDRIVREGSIPMLQRFGIHVVGYGPSLDDSDVYYLIRAFPSAARREEQLDHFYGSDEWLRNYREAVLALIETYHVVVVELTPAIGNALMAAIPAQPEG
jgi:hypothetical protein